VTLRTESYGGRFRVESQTLEGEAMLFTSAKLTRLNALPQGQPRRDQRTLGMVVMMMNEPFGSCTNHGESEAVCLQEISLEFIGQMNRDLLREALRLAGARPPKPPGRAPLCVLGKGSKVR
jgi:hypothetical protein